MDVRTAFVSVLITVSLVKVVWLVPEREVLSPSAYR
jgi:hypothetical protein